MNNLKNIREKFGISQQQVADWLGISRSLAQLYEQGTQSLPAYALVQLSKLEMMVAEFEKEERGISNIEQGTRNDEGEGCVKSDFTVQAHPRLAVELDKKERLMQQLAILKSRHAVLQQQMLLIKNMLDNCNEQTSEKEERWLKMLYLDLCCKISKFGEAKQIEMKGKILEMRIREEMMRKKVS